MTEPSGAAPPEAPRSAWAEVIRWPLQSGMLGGVVALALCAAASVAFEGGDSQPAREQRAWGQAVVAFASLAVLGVYARRAVACTYPVERPVPWGRDEQDGVPFTQGVGNFLAVLVISFLPLAAWLGLRRAFDTPSWLGWTIVAATGLFGAALLPLGYAGSSVSGTVLSALPGPVRRMARAEPHAARIASTTSIVFVAMLLLSAWLSVKFVGRPDSMDFGLPGEARHAPPDPVGNFLRVVLFVLRAAAFHAALVSFRVAGLLVREVPEVREALR